MHVVYMSAGESEKLMRLMKEKVAEWQSMDDSERVTTVWDYACKNGGANVGKIVEVIWKKQFWAST